MLPELTQGLIDGSHPPRLALILPCFSKTRWDPRSLPFWQSFSGSLRLTKPLEIQNQVPFRSSCIYPKESRAFDKWSDLWHASSFSSFLHNTTSQFNLINTEKHFRVYTSTHPVNRIRGRKKKTHVNNTKRYVA